MRSETVSGLFPVWTVLGVTGLAASSAVVVAVGVGETLVLGGLWFAGPAVGFLARDFYVCGLPPTVVDARERLRELGAPDGWIHGEGREEGAASEE